MLSRLTIQNYALIDNLDISFDAGLNLLTGETGAGKSIILGALSLILGQRAEGRYFFNQQKKCIIEGIFSIKQFHLKSFFEDNDLDYEPDTVLRREIASDGKSRAFINDTPVNLATLKQLGEKLIDIHSQHATREINDPEFQLMVVDSLANHHNLVDQYHIQYNLYKKKAAALAKQIAENNQAKADQDYFQFQFDELEEANLLAGEQEELKQELFALNHAETIKSSLGAANYLLAEGDQAVMSQLKESLQHLNSLEKYHPKTVPLTERLQSTFIELKDIVAEIQELEQNTVLNENRIVAVNDRLNIFYTLQKKHRLADNNELIKLQKELSEKLNQILFGDEHIEELQEELNEIKSSLIVLAEQISLNRDQAMPILEKEVKNLVAELGMNDASLKAVNQKSAADDFDKNGIDRIKFLFSANKGHELAEMSKVASGGELARLMLSIKSIMAKTTALPTIIFDEIDTGVSGEVAHKVGNIMEKLSRNLQVITITHLPQIASKGKSHFFVYKDNSEEVTFTRIKKLSDAERITELAKMLSGDKPGDSAIQNARDLLQL